MEDLWQVFVLFKDSFKDPRYCSLGLFRDPAREETFERIRTMRGQWGKEWSVMNECIDSTMGRIHVCFAVLLASDNPRTQYSKRLGSRIALRLKCPAYYPPVGTDAVWIQLPIGQSRAPRGNVLLIQWFVSAPSEKNPSNAPIETTN